jgi:Ni,Fe-hydrogenase maturation factor
VVLKKIFVFGNPLLEKDSLALKVAERLEGEIKGIEFVPVQSLEEVGDIKALWILDVAKGIERVRLIEDLDRLQAAQPVSGHDFDLAMELKVLKKVGKIGKVKIIAVPSGYDLEKAAKEVRELLT